MQFKNAVLFAAGLAAQQAAAGWSDASGFSCPGNTDNQCSSSQQSGYNWSGLQTGSFSSYGSNQFSGFSCSSSFGKRDLLTKRGFQPKCISGSLDSSPSMSGGQFSIDQMQISSSQDAEIECHYGMPDGSTCKETHSCNSGGAIFKNTQCGGAKSVTFKPGKGAPPGCSIGVHSVGFHCGSSSTPPSSPSTSVSVQSHAPPPPPSSVPAPSGSSPPCYGPQCSGSSPPAPPASTMPPAPSSAPPSPHCYGSTCSSSPVAPASSTAPCYGAGCSSAPPPPPSGSAPPPPCYGTACSTSPVAPVSSSMPPPPSYTPPASPSGSAPPPPPCYGTACSTSPVAPVSSSMPPPPSYTPPAPPSGSAPPPPCYGTACSTSPVAPVSSSMMPPPPSYMPPAPSGSSPPAPPAPHCPDVLPKCLKTWMFVTQCIDNSDTSCFCGNEMLIKNVMACLAAWSTSDSDTQAAASYLMGLCAPHIPNNPAIITACPPGVTPGPTPAASSPAMTGAPTPPCTTITYSSSVVIPATYSTGVSAGFTCPGSSMTTMLVTTVTVPQVQLTTSTVTVAGTTTQAVSLAAGSPTAVPAYTTPPPVATTASVAVCSEFVDGQPQCAATPAPGMTPPAGSSPVAAASTFGTSWGTSWAAPSASGMAPIVPATGAGAKVGSSLVSLALGVVAALAAL